MPDDISRPRHVAVKLHQQPTLLEIACETLNYKNVEMWRRCKCEHAKYETAKMWKCSGNVNMNIRNIKMQRNGNVNVKLQSGNAN